MTHSIKPQINVREEDNNNNIIKYTCFNERATIYTKYKTDYEDYAINLKCKWI